MTEDPDWGHKVFPLLRQAEENYRANKLKQDPITKANLEVAAATGDTTDEEIIKGVNDQIITPDEGVTLSARNKLAKLKVTADHAEKVAEIEAEHKHEFEKKTRINTMYRQASEQGGGAMLFEPHEVPNKKGDGMEEMTVDEQIKGVIKTHEETVEAEVEQFLKNGDTEGAANHAINRHLEFYSKNRWERDKWKNAMAGIQLSLPSALAAKEPIPDHVREGGAVFIGLYSKAPALLRKMVPDDDTWLTLEAYRMAKLRGDPDQQAWFTAAGIAERKAKGELSPLYVKPADLDAAIKKVDKSFFSGMGAEVTMDMREQLQKRANMLYWTGVPADKVLDQAADSLSDEYGLVNGFAVNIADPRTPPDFMDRIDDVMRGKLDQFGRYNDMEEQDQLRLVPLGANEDTGAWTMWGKLGPILDDKDQPVIVTNDDINWHRAVENEQKKWDAIETAQGKSTFAERLKLGLFGNDSRSAKDRWKLIKQWDAERADELARQRLLLDKEGSENISGPVQEKSKKIIDDGLSLPGLQPGRLDDGMPKQITPSKSGNPMPFQKSELNDGKIKIEPAAFQLGKVRNPHDVAKLFNGLGENTHREIIADFMKKSAGINIDPRRTAWCAGFVNAVLGASGFEGSGSLAARSFLNYGKATSTPTRGDIAVFSRTNDPSKGHVGFFDSIVIKGGKKYVRILGGNQGKSGNVSFMDMPVDKLLGFRRPPMAGQTLS